MIGIVGGSFVRKPDSLRQSVVEIATSLVGSDYHCCESAAPGYDLSVVSWCQIFWLHCLREAGLTTKTWSDLASSGWVGGWLPTTRDPKPGDLAYINQPKQHGAVVQRVEGYRIYRIYTVDGNSTGRVVRLRDRDRHEFDAFYSISSLLEDTPDTEPAPSLATGRD